jgi:O-antigen/teichoic acid export membrane protein
MKQSIEINQFGKNVGYVIIGNIVTTILIFLQIPILTRGLGTASYGDWSLINVTISLISPFAILAFNSSIVRFLAVEQDNNKVREDFFSACLIVTLLGIALSALLFLFSGLMAKTIFGDIKLTSVIKLSSVLILLNALYPLLTSFFSMKRNIGLYSIFTTLYSIILTSLMFLFIFLGKKLEGAIIAWIISLTVVNLIALVIILGKIGFRRPRFSNLGSYLKYGLPLVGSPAILWIIYASDRYLISYFLGAAATGIYSAAFGVGGYANFILPSVGIVLFPTISKLFDEGDFDRTRLYMKYTFKYLMMVIIPAAAGLSILGRQLLRIVATPAFVSGNTIVPFIAFGSVFSCFYQICIYVMYLTHKTQVNVRLLLTAAVVNVLLNLLLIPLMGIIGSAVASLVAFGILGGITLIMSRRYFKFDVSPSFILKSFISASIMTVCIWLIKSESIFQVAVAIIIGIIVYFAVLVLVRGFSRQEFSFFTSFIRNTFKRNRRANTN